MRYLSALPIAVALVASAGAAHAHPKLLSARPASNAIVATPARIKLVFSETLVAAFSKAEVTMAAMPGMAAMAVPATTALAPDGRTLLVTTKGKLAAGRYGVDWHVVSTDTHKAAGRYAFTVK